MKKTNQISVSELAGRTGLDEKTVRRILFNVPSQRDGRRAVYASGDALEAVEAYLSRRQPKTLSPEQQQYWTLRNQKLQIEIDQLRGSLYEKEKVDSFFHGMFAIQRGTLLTTFNSLPVTLAGLDVAQMRVELDATFNKIMAGFKRGMENWKYEPKETDAQK